jgi:hypothetical protein
MEERGNAILNPLSTRRHSLQVRERADCVREEEAATRDKRVARAGLDPVAGGRVEAASAWEEEATRGGGPGEGAARRPR